MFTGVFVDSFIITPYVEQEKAEYVWNISAGPYETATPNVLSELTFSDINSRGYGIQLALNKMLSDSWSFYLEGSYTDNSIKDGSAQDSDYLGDSRTEEFSRSYAEISGDDDTKHSLTMGLRTRWFGKPNHYLTLLFGHQSQKNNLRFTNGIQIIPEDQEGISLENLDSTYNSEFSSWKAGIASEHVFSFGTVGIRYESLDVEFDAEADWNLRDDLAHPVSFIHTGEGTGATWTIGYSKKLNRLWDVFLNYFHSSYDVEDGYDHTFSAEGEGYVTTLNEVSFESKSLQIGFRYIF